MRTPSVHQPCSPDAIRDWATATADSRIASGLRGAHEPPGRSVGHEEAHFVDLGEFRSAQHGGHPMSITNTSFLRAALTVYRKEITDALRDGARSSSCSCRA